MYARIWRVIAVGVGALMMALLVMDALAALFANGGPGFTSSADLEHPGTSIVQSIDDPRAIAGTLHPGDHVRLEDSSLYARLAFARQRIGDRFVFDGTTAQGAPTRFTDTMIAKPVGPDFWVYEITALAFVGVGLVVAMRRPNDPTARTMVALFLTMATLFVAPVPWLSPWTALALITARTFSQVWCAYCALRLATTFPTRSATGVRRWIERINPWLTGASLATIFTQYFDIMRLQKTPAWRQNLGLSATLAYFALITIAFIIAGRTAAPADRKRVNWVAYSVAVGFSGSIVVVIQFAFGRQIAPWENYLGLTLIAIPVGLGYAIVRHRVVDIGFVVNRAVVFGTLSAIVVAAFMVLEWALSNAAMKISHITSTSLEIALALGLGFSMRTLHSRVDHFVDDLFFRDRHAAEQALRTLARDVGYISEPQVAVARVFEGLRAHSGATLTAIYAVDGPVALRIDPAAQSEAPVSFDDPALVRMRASRSPCELAGLATALPGARAFPMLVRDTLSGLVVLGAKANGEEYAPDELSAIEALVLALGNALDALQTAALKREIARVLLDGAPLDALRRTIDSPAWIRGVAQPAGPLVGLGE